MTPPEQSDVRDRIIRAIRTVRDPEIPLNIYDLGLIYDIAIDDNNRATVKMTLTSPGCPVADMLVNEVQCKTKDVEGVTDAVVELVWDPPWSHERMSDAARLELNLEPDMPPPGLGPQRFFEINTEPPSPPKAIQRPQA